MAEKSNLGLWNLFIVSLGLTHQGGNNDFGFNSIKKSTFPKTSHFNALESKFDLDVK